MSSDETEEEINKNEKLWREENHKDVDVDPQGSDLRSIGVSAGDMEADTQSAEEMNAPEPEAQGGIDQVAAVGSAPAGSPAAGGAPGAGGM